MSQQATTDAFGTAAPTTGKPLPERTHYAHARYAASDEAGVIWFDPRDCHEVFSVPDVPPDSAVSHDDKVITRLKIHAKRARCEVVAPAECEWVLKWQYKTRETWEKPPDVDDVEFVTSYGASKTYDTRTDAHDAAEELCDAYAAAEYRNAVATRTDIGGGDD